MRLGGGKRTGGLAQKRPVRCVQIPAALSAGGDPNLVHAHAGHFHFHLLLARVPQRQNGKDGADANGKAQHRQYGPHRRLEYVDRRQVNGIPQPHGFTTFSRTPS